MVPSRLGDSSPLDLATGLELARLQRAPSGARGRHLCPSHWTAVASIIQDQRARPSSQLPRDSGKGFGGVGGQFIYNIC